MVIVTAGDPVVVVAVVVAAVVVEIVIATAVEVCGVIRPAALSCPHDRRLEVQYIPLP
jgi:hypothetical protein